MPRFSANLHFLFPEHALLARFAAARAAGFTAVEFPDPYSYPLPALTARLAEHDLACVLINLPMGDPTRGDKGLACLPDRQDEFRASVARGVAAARALGCPRANCMAGVAPPGADPALVHATLVDNLRFAARAFGDAGLTLTTEALNTRDVPGFFLSGSDQAAALIAEVAEDNLRFQLDLYHMRMMGEDVLATIARHFPIIEHVQFAEVPGRHEPGPRDDGGVPFHAAAAALDARGYRGFMGAEYHPRDPNKGTLATLAWLR